LEAVRVPDVAVTMQFNVPGTAAVPVTLMLRGEGVHVTPGGSVDGVTITVPVKPPVGVTVTVSGTAVPVDELRVSVAGL
jgi:hypothetical protein